MDITPLLEQIRETNRQAVDLLRDRSLLAVSGRRIVLTLLTWMLAEPSQWVGAATCEQGGLDLLEERRPDLLFVTDPLEAGSGIELVRQAKARHPDLPCLLLLEEDSVERVRAALEAGTDGICVDRRVGLGHLLAATRAVLGGGAYMDGPVAGLLSRTSRGSSAARPDALTPREREVLQEMVRGSRNEEIARRLYVSEETVRTHIKAVIRKLAARNRTHAAVIALGLGLARWDAPADHFLRQ